MILMRDQDYAPLPARQPQRQGEPLVLWPKERDLRGLPGSARSMPQLHPAGEDSMTLQSSRSATRLKIKLGVRKARRPYLECRTYFCKPDITQRDRTAWLGMSESNSEMSSGSIHLRRRTDFQKSNRILATETIRVWAAAFQIRSSGRGPGSRQGSE